jgi:Dolichyl-phosphate-mannose-protein mannosyltransferase
MNQPKANNITLFLVLFLLAVNLFFYSGRFHSIDEMALLSTTESMVKWQRTDVNSLAWGQWLLRGPDSQGLFNAQGDLYAKKAPLVAWLAIPIYALAGLAQLGQVQATTLLNALVVALTGGVVFRFARRLGYRTGVAAWAALLFGVGTSALVYAKYLFTEPLAGLGFLLAAQAVWRAQNERMLDARSLALGGAGLGAACLTNPINALFAPLFLLALLIPGRRTQATDSSKNPLPLGRIAILMLIPLALGIALLAAWNTAHFGNPLVSGYHLGAGEGFTSPLRISLPGLLVSPARGLLWFVPVSLLALAGLPLFFRRHTRLAALALALIAGHVLVFGAWWMWWSGWGWGPRFLVPITPFIALLALPALDYSPTKPRIPTAQQQSRHLKFDIFHLILVPLIFALSAGVQILGASVGFDEYENIMTQTHLRGDPEGDLYKYGLDMLWSWRDSPIVGHWKLLRAGNTDLAWLPGGHVDWRMLVPLVVCMAATAIALGYVARQEDAEKARRGDPERLGARVRYGAVAVCLALVFVVLWRARAHPLRATYGLDPTEGEAALSAVMSRSQPGDGVMLIRPLSPAEMDRFPRFPPVYGIPDESLFGAEWNSDLERLVDNAQARQRRLWLIVRSEDDPFAAQIADRLKPRMRRTGRAEVGGYAVVLWEPR